DADVLHQRGDARRLVRHRAAAGRNRSGAPPRRHRRRALAGCFLAHPVNYRSNSETASLIAVSTAMSATSLTKSFGVYDAPGALAPTDAHIVPARRFFGSPCVDFRNPVKSAANASVVAPNSSWNAASKSRPAPTRSTIRERRALMSAIPPFHCV